MKRTRLTIGKNEVAYIHNNPQALISLLPPSSEIDGAGKMVIQPKLVVGHPDDPLEREANQAADRVVNLWQNGSLKAPGAATIPKPTHPLIQRRAVSAEADAIQAPPEVAQQIQSARGGGQALPASLQPSLEAAFGMDFSGVRLHTDARAHALNRDLQARAFTTGRDIFFREGAYQPHTAEGVRLLGHELGHVGQQSDNVIKRQVQLGVINIEGDTDRYWRAHRGNLRYARRFLQLGWPYTEDLRKLWLHELYDDFINMVMDFQIRVMGVPEDRADGIMGPNTARAILQNRGDNPILPTATDTSTALSTEGEGTDLAVEFADVPEDLMDTARTTSRPIHEQVYNRLMAEGRDFGMPGLAPTWSGFIDQMQTYNFFGYIVNGHPVFLERLNRAKQYLLSNPSLQGIDFSSWVGRGGPRSDWRHDEDTTSSHVFGMAIDIRGAQNPWISNPASAERSRKVYWLIWRAVWLMGRGSEPVWPSRLQTVSQLSTREIYDRLKQSSDDVVQYLQLLTPANEEVFRQKLASLSTLAPEQPPVSFIPTNVAIPELLSKNEEAWARAIRFDSEVSLLAPGSRNPGGFLNLQYELVYALRDIAGLSWGAVDIGGRESGDFMHFDLRTPGFERFRSEVRRLNRQAGD